MPKKKAKSTVRKTSVRKANHHIDDHSFMIIVGGGLVILLIIGLFFMNTGAPIRRAAAQPDTSMTQEQKQQTVVIKDFAFSPETLVVKVGTTVTWVNNDSVAHSAVADDGTFDTKLLASGEKGSYTFTKAGTYTYKCGIHPSMTGKIVVEE